MQLQLSEEDASFRDEMRAFFTTKVSQDIRDAVAERRELTREQIVESQRTLNAAGLAVPHWPEEHRATTLGVLLVRMVAETAQHAGHADIVREMIDGQAGNDSNFADDVDFVEFTSQVQRAADSFRS